MLRNWRNGSAPDPAAELPRLRRENDHAKRVVNIKTPDGKFQTIDVPPAAKRFDELKVGDKVSITYNNTVSARLKPPGEAPVNTATGTSTAGQGERPGGTASAERTMTVTI